MTTPDENGQLPLHKALQSNDITLGSIKLLVKGNPSAVQTPDNGGALPLHLASQRSESSISIVKYLLGLDPTSLGVVDEQGNTALHYACRGAKHKMILLLTNKKMYGAVSKRNACNELPIHLLLLSNEVSDRECIEYTDSIFRLIRAYPETVMRAQS
jgi:ankyrin repeat protein